MAPQRCVNFYPQRIKDGFALYPTPGLTSFAAAPESPGRGIFGESDRCFAVIGSALYEIFADGTKTNRGTVATNQYPATLFTNGDGGGQLGITSGDTAYSYNLTTNVLSSATADATMGGMIDGYGVVLDIDTSKLRVSNLLDLGTYDPTQTAQRSTASDPWKAMLVKYPRIWLLGEHTGDVWYNAQTSPFPFAPVPSVQIPYGCKAPFSLKACGQSVMWLTQTQQGGGQVVEAQGYTPTVVSDEPLEYALSQYSRIDDAVAYSYQEQGHDFYCLNFPSAKATWVYDQTERTWHERGTWNTTTASYGIFGPQYHAHVFGHHLVLHAENGTVYRQSVDLATDASSVLIRRMRIPPVLEHVDKKTQIPGLQLDLEAGLGLTSGQGSDPRVSLRMSKDGSKTWGNERYRSAGTQGQYTKRVIWRRCGQGWKMVPEIVVSDPIPWRMKDLHILGAS